MAGGAPDFMLRIETNLAQVTADLNSAFAAAAKLEGAINSIPPTGGGAGKKGGGTAKQQKRAAEQGPGAIPTSAFGATGDLNLLGELKMNSVQINSIVTAINTGSFRIVQAVNNLNRAIHGIGQRGNQQVPLPIGNVPISQRQGFGAQGQAVMTTAEADKIRIDEKNKIKSAANAQAAREANAAAKGSGVPPAGMVPQAGAGDEGPPPLTTLDRSALEATRKQLQRQKIAATPRGVAEREALREAERQAFKEASIRATTPQEQARLSREFDEAKRLRRLPSRKLAEESLTRAAEEKAEESGIVRDDAQRIRTAQTAKRTMSKKEMEAARKQQTEFARRQSLIDQRTRELAGAERQAHTENKAFNREKSKNFKRLQALDKQKTKEIESARTQAIAEEKSRNAAIASEDRSAVALSRKAQRRLDKRFSAEEKALRDPVLRQDFMFDKSGKILRTPDGQAIRFRGDARDFPSGAGGAGGIGDQDQFAQTRAKADIESEKLRTSLKKKGTDATKSQTQAQLNLNKAAGQHTNLLATQIRRTLLWTAAAGLIFGAVTAARAFLNVMIDMDKQMADLRKTLAGSQKDFENLTGGAVDAARKFKAPTKDVLDAIELFSKKFKRPEDLETLSESAVLFSNISGQSLGQSAETLTSVLQQYNLAVSDAEKVTDSWAGVAAQTATTVKELGDAVGVVGVAARTAGVDLDQLNAITAAVTAGTGQSGRQTGNALKRIFERTFSPENARTLQENNVRVFQRVRNQDTGENEIQNRPFLDILKELNKNWDKLSDTQRKNIAVAFSGARQYNSFLAIMNNYDEIIRLTEVSQNSQGAAMMQNDRIAGTFKKSLTSLGVEFDALARNASGVLGVFQGLIDGVTSLLKAFNDLSKEEDLGGLGNLGKIAQSTIASVVALGAVVGLTRFAVSGGLGTTFAGGRLISKRRAGSGSIDPGSGKGLLGSPLDPTEGDVGFKPGIIDALIARQFISQSTTGVQRAQFSPLKGISRFGDVVARSARIQSPGQGVTTFGGGARAVGSGVAKLTGIGLIANAAKGFVDIIKSIGMKLKDLRSGVSVVSVLFGGGLATAATTLVAALAAVAAVAFTVFKVWDEFRDKGEEIIKAMEENIATSRQKSEQDSRLARAVGSEAGLAKERAKIEEGFKKAAERGEPVSKREQDSVLAEFDRTRVTGLIKDIGVNEAGKQLVREQGITFNKFGDAVITTTSQLEKLSMALEKNAQLEREKGEGIAVEGVSDTLVEALKLLSGRGEISFIRGAGSLQDSNEEITLAPTDVERRKREALKETRRRAEEEGIKLDETGNVIGPGGFFSKDKRRLRTIATEESNKRDLTLVQKDQTGLNLTDLREIKVGKEAVLQIRNALRGEEGFDRSKKVEDITSRDINALRARGVFDVTNKAGETGRLSEDQAREMLEILRRIAISNDTLRNQLGLRFSEFKEENPNATGDELFKAKERIRNELQKKTIQDLGVAAEDIGGKSFGDILINKLLDFDLQSLFEKASSVGILKPEEGKISKVKLPTITRIDLELQKNLTSAARDYENLGGSFVQNATSAVSSAISALASDTSKAAGPREEDSFLNKQLTIAKDIKELEDKAKKDPSRENLDALRALQLQKQAIQEMNDEREKGIAILKQEMMVLKATQIIQESLRGPLKQAITSLGPNFRDRTLGIDQFEADKRFVDKKIAREIEIQALEDQSGTQVTNTPRGRNRLRALQEEKNQIDKQIEQTRERTDTFRNMLNNIGGGFVSQLGGKAVDKTVESIGVDFFGGLDKALGFELFGEKNPQQQLLTATTDNTKALDRNTAALMGEGAGTGPLGGAMSSAIGGLGSLAGIGGLPSVSPLGVFSAAAGLVSSAGLGGLFADEFGMPNGAGDALEGIGAIGEGLSLGEKSLDDLFPDIDPLDTLSSGGIGEDIQNIGENLSTLKGGKGGLKGIFAKGRADFKGLSGFGKLKAVGGGALVGAGVGSFATNILGREGNRGAIGGAIGGGIGSAFGPVGALAGSAIGGFLGGLFDKKKEPDEKDLPEIEPPIEKLILEIKTLEKSLNTVNDTMENIINAPANFVLPIAQGILSNSITAQSAIATPLQAGGLILQSGPAFLHTGERVTSADAVRRGEGAGGGGNVNTFNFNIEAGDNNPSEIADEVSRRMNSSFFEENQRVGNYQQRF